MSKPINLKRLNGPMVIVGGHDVDDAPRLHIHDHDDPRICDMPDEGEARIKYKIHSREHREEKGENGKKKHRYSVTMAVHHIEPPEKKVKPQPKGLDDARKSAKDYFDKLP
jgi:hypothetical protein